MLAQPAAAVEHKRLAVCEEVLMCRTLQLPSELAGKDGNEWLVAQRLLASLVSHPLQLRPQEV